jgi:3-hydroxyacyl-CoA dehydrogenase
MGPQLAAMFAACGVRTLLFGRRGRARVARTHLKKTRPPALYTSDNLERIEALDISSDAHRLKECDWVIECIAEKRDAKQKLFREILPNLKDDAILTSNTSGLTLRSLAGELDESIRSRFFITHFFYPPRYMKLVEIVTSSDVDEEKVERIKSFLEERVGKGIVFAKDTPNFMANRIGVVHVMDAFHMVGEKGWPIEAVDLVLGPIIGRPTTGIFRMADMVGIDTVVAVAGTIVIHCPDDLYSSRCRVPQYVQAMIARGWTGAKGGGGFYRKDEGRRSVIDPARLEYRPALRFTPLSILKSVDERDVAARMRNVVMADDAAGEIAWPLVSNAIVYAAERAHEIADDIESIDCAMKWGFGWQLGPFETWDALGVENVCEQLTREGRPIPKLVQELTGSGQRTFYEKPPSASFFSFSDESVVLSNRAGRLMSDEGIGVVALDHPKGIVDDKCYDLLSGALKRLEFEWPGLVITNDGENFLTQGNLYDLLNKVRLKKWKEIETQLVRDQLLSQRIKYSRRPIVFAPTGALAGVGAELCLASGNRSAWVESSLWLNHILLGLIPSAGGCLNVLRACENAERLKRESWCRNEGMCEDGGPHPKVKKTFELIGGAIRSGSAFESKELGLFAPEDSVVMDRDKLLNEAKYKVMKLAEDYLPPEQSDIALPGYGGELALKNDIKSYLRLGLLKPDDAVICVRLARVLSGGDYPTAHLAGEQHVLDLEREAYLSLLGTEMTQRRIEHFLKTGKYLTTNG